MPDHPGNPGADDHPKGRNYPTDPTEIEAGRVLLAELQRLGFVRITTDGAITRNMDEIARHDPALPDRIARHMGALARAMEEASIALEAWWERRRRQN